ncbi:putative Cytochrome b5-like Heme/Steroid binding domain containing protein [Leishmania utingensis]|uniref:Cytochrome b5-like Heme/Steroid binding domain containing protein n=1 Tax=Leishmania utingensis TaxID=653362 RepID=A0AAW3AAX5_9TRYP
MLKDLLLLSGLKKRWPVISEEEIRMHNTRRSLWIVSGNSVYDVTGLLGSHPGGEAAILRRGGGSKNCEADYAFHSRYARREWDNRKVGEITSEVAMRLFPPRTGTHEANMRSATECAAGPPPVGISRTHINSGEESHTRTVDTYASTTVSPDQQYHRYDYASCRQRVL